VVNKQKLMQPVFDPESRDQVNMRSAKGNWLTQLIGRDSTYEGRGLKMNANKCGEDPDRIKLD
jgi:hypothetical protein